MCAHVGTGEVISIHLLFLSLVFALKIEGQVVRKERCMLNGGKKGETRISKDKLEAMSVSCHLFDDANKRHGEPMSFFRKLNTHLVQKSEKLKLKVQGELKGLQTCL